MSPGATTAPLVVAVDMGYGHLRPAHALAERLGVPVVELDRAPLAGPLERRAWRLARAAYAGLTRAARWPRAGRPLGRLHDQLTAIPPLESQAALDAPDWSVRLLAALAAHGLGAGLLAELRARPRPLVTTFYSAAIVADRRVDSPVFCVVTDADVQRVWAPARAAATRIHYLVPSERAGERLAAYGVPAAQLTLTGFPLPDALLGGPELTVARRNLAARLRRLDPRGLRRDELDLEPGLTDPGPSQPPLLTFAVGGTGAQAELVERFLPSLRPLVAGGRLRLALVAGVHHAVAERLRRAVEAAGLGGAPDHLELLTAPDFPTYVRAFNALLARTDVVWTKPSELTFFAALGLPLVIAPPVGRHEEYNRRWALEAGAGLDQRDPRRAGDWLAAWLADGTLAAAARAGFARLPRRGLYRIVERVRRDG